LENLLSSTLGTSALEEGLRVNQAYPNIDAHRNGKVLLETFVLSGTFASSATLY
jgi:hypothetical protein